MININEFLNTVIDDCLLINGDCLKVMDKLIENNIKVDAIIADIPYQITACKWDKMIPFEDMWNKLNQLIKDNGVIALFGNEPFSSKLRLSNLKMYKYDWIWQKDRHTNFLFAKKQPLKKHEIISIFYNKQPTYNPQMTIGKPNHKMFSNDKQTKTQYKELMNQEVILIENKQDGLKYPSSIQFFKSISRGKNIHPTQKPIELMEYLIKTYTNENELVLDFTAGSFSTGVACQNTNRKFIGIELEEKYYNIGIERMMNNKENNDKTKTNK